MAATFGFEFDPRFKVALALVGVRPASARVTVGDDVDVRFGPWRLRTPRTNVVSAEVTGPYRWYTSIGARYSLADGGATFGSTPRGGVCLTFREPVPALLPGRLLRHRGLTVTVADPSGLKAALTDHP